MAFTVAQPPFQTNQEQEKKKKKNQFFVFTSKPEAVTEMRSDCECKGPLTTEESWGEKQWRLMTTTTPGWTQYSRRVTVMQWGFRILIGLAHGCSGASDQSSACWLDGKKEMAVCFLFFFLSVFLSSLLRPAWMLFFITIIFLVILQRFGLSQRERSSHFVLWKIKGKGFISVQTRRKVMHAVLIMLFSIFSLNLKGGMCGGFTKVKN